MTVEESVERVKHLKLAFKEMLNDGLTKTEFEECIVDLNKINTAPARIMVRLIQTHLDSLE